MKKSLCIFLIALICISLSACGAPQRSECFGFTVADYSVVQETETHGGFLGDGVYSLTLDCSEQRETAQALVETWKPLPLTENITLVMYGGEKDGTIYGYNYAEEAKWPTTLPKNGVYKFVDRHDAAEDATDDTDLFRGSFNFSLAVYDLDTDTLYYCEVDT